LDCTFEEIPFVLKQMDFSFIKSVVYSFTKDPSLSLIPAPIDSSLTKPRSVTSLALPSVEEAKPASVPGLPLVTSLSSEAERVGNMAVEVLVRPFKRKAFERATKSRLKGVSQFKRKAFERATKSRLKGVSQFKRKAFVRKT
jgi:hypothetical protein